MWNENQLSYALEKMATLCGLITWEQKEELLDLILKFGGWTREELKAFNRRRELNSN
jgi:hypothetical protein